MIVEIDAPQLLHIIHHDQVRVEIDDVTDNRRKEAGEVDARIIERLVECLSDRV